MSNKVYSIVAPQDETADTEASRAIADQLGNVIDETYAVKDHSHEQYVYRSTKSYNELTTNDVIALNIGLVMPELGKSSNVVFFDSDDNIVSISISRAGNPDQTITNRIFAQVTRASYSKTFDQSMLNDSIYDIVIGQLRNIGSSYGVPSAPETNDLRFLRGHKYHGSQEYDYVQLKTINDTSLVGSGNITTAKIGYFKKQATLGSSSTTFYLTNAELDMFCQSDMTFCEITYYDYVFIIPSMKDRNIYDDTFTSARLGVYQTIYDINVRFDKQAKTLTVSRIRSNTFVVEIKDNTYISLSGSINMSDDFLLNSDSKTISLKKHLYRHVVQFTQGAGYSVCLAEILNNSPTKFTAASLYADGCLNTQWNGYCRCAMCFVTETQKRFIGHTFWMNSASSLTVQYIDHDVSETPKTYNIPITYFVDTVTQLI